jgi:hypothetical protein
VKADVILVDMGPNLGAINRSALIAADYVIILLGSDLFSIQGLRNLGPTLRDWSAAWRKRLENWFESPEAKEHPGFSLPDGKMNILGYLFQRHGGCPNGQSMAYEKWVGRIPQEYRARILAEEPGSIISPADDPYCLATVKHYRSLVPMGQEVRKPIFKLTPADGAIGSHAASVRDALRDFQNLAQTIAEKIMLSHSGINMF